MELFVSKDSDQYLAEKRKEWVGTESNDYVVTDVVREKYSGLMTPLLVVRCKVCNVTKKMTIQSFTRGKNEHGPYCLLKDWDAKIQALKDQYIGTRVGDFVCFDVLKQWNRAMNCYSPTILAECQVCHSRKEFPVRDFITNANKHDKLCTIVNDFKGHVGETIGDQHILNYFRKGSTGTYTAQCVKCNRIYEIGCQKFFKRSSQTHEHLCTTPVGTVKFRDTFCHMKNRCNNEHCEDYKNYGGRGIKVLWNDINEFYNDMFESYKKLAKDIGEDQVSIERINVNGDYCKENCKWIPLSDQESNKRNTIYFLATDPNGVEFCGRNLSSFSRAHGLSENHMVHVMKGMRTHHKGWKCRRISVEEYEKYCDEHLTVFNDMIWEFLNEKYDERITDRPQDVYPEGLYVSVLEVSSSCNVYLWNELIDSLVTAKNPYGLDITYHYGKKCFFLKKAKDFIEPEAIK